MWADKEAISRVNTFIAERVCEIVELPYSLTLANALDKCQQEILALETTVFSFPEIQFRSAVLSLKEHVDLRRFLRAKQHFLANDDRIGNLLVEILGVVFSGIISRLPRLEETAGEAQLSVPLVCLMRKPGDLVDAIIGTFCTKELVEAGLFTTLQECLYSNVCSASGVSPEDEKHRRQLITANNSELPPIELIKT